MNTIDVRKVQTQNCNRKRAEKLDWMYSIGGGGSSGTGVNMMDKEDFLLGAKKVDKLVQGDAVS
jgi:hypothetical protein